jgi:hypothetical protein
MALGEKMNGVESFMKALGILFTMISLRAAIKSLQSDTKVVETQTEILRRIDARLAQMTEPESTDDYDLW